MAILRQPNSLTITATNDGVAFAVPVEVVGASFQGTGLTLGQQITLRDSATVGAGSILADYAMTGTSAAVDLWGARPARMVQGVSLANTTAGGTWVVTVFYR